METCSYFKKIKEELTKNNIVKEIISANGNLYQLVRLIREDQLKHPNMEDLKEYFLCDTLLRKQGLLYFCRIIEEIEYEEINE